MIANNYVIKTLIGKGKFGNVYLGECSKTSETVAIKIESSKSPVQLLKNETAILNYLYHNGCRKMPFIYWYGKYETNPCLIMTRYDIALCDYAAASPVDDAQVVDIMKKIINILKGIHDSSIIHRDIKPQNFMIKNGDLYLVDFGLATVFIDDSKNHIKETRDNMNILGTPKYSSIHLHDGTAASRRDDVISCGYVYLFLLLGGRLPWENLPDAVDHTEYDESHILHYKNQERARQKSWKHLQIICQDRDPGLVRFFENAYSIGFGTRPRYDDLILQ
jgi:serine/threonine protein kinase